jgi:spore germination protein YaaH
MTRRIAPLLAAAVFAALVAAPQAEARAKVCAAPTKLTFKRAPGASAGKLRWHRARGVARGTRYRVYRNRDVIGQTRRNWMKVRVSVGVRYRFTVRLVSPRGRLRACRAGIRKLVAYNTPSTPGNFAVTGARGAAAHLEWSRSRRGDAAVKSYRVLRGGVTYKQITGTSIDVPISNDRTYQFAVAAVDVHGKLSRPTKPVTVDSGHIPPPAPANVIAGDVTDTGMILSWSPSVPARGRVTGYRVYRDGKVLRGVQGISTRITGLAAGSSHVWTVAAVDSSGWLSPQSAPANISTAPPIPSTGSAQAFVLASTDKSFADFRAHYRQVGVVYPTYFDCSADAQLTGRDDPFITSWSKARGVKVLPRFNCQRTTVLNRILNDGTLRTRWLDQLVALVQQNGYDGLNLDFEAGLASDRAAYTSFFTELASRLHAQGKLLSVAVSAKTADVANHPRSSFFDYNALAQQADWVFVMTWGIHWTTSGPGSLDDINWMRAVMDYIDTIPGHERFVIGTALYGFDWANGGGSSNPATPYEYSDIQALIDRVGATPRHDDATGSMTFSYRDGSDSHDVWYANASTTHLRMQEARNHGLGIGFWRLGSEDQRMWDDALLAAP